MSTIFIGVVLFISKMIYKFSNNNEYARKFVHVILGFWPYIGFSTFDNIWTLISVPVLFIIVNYLSAKYHLMAFMEREDQSYGTVWYALSLTILMLFGRLFNLEHLAINAMLILSLGDGFAALFGRAFGHNKVSFIRDSKKTNVGCVTMFVVSSLLTLMFNIELGLLNNIVLALLVALGATTVELFSEHGMDNFYVPQISILIMYLATLHHIIIVTLITIITILILLKAYRKQSLSKEAVPLALMIAYLMVILGNLVSYLGLIVFFVASSLIERFSNDAKVKATSLHLSSGTRGVSQVLMNTLPALTMLIIGALLNHQTDFFNIAALSAYAISTADTFASEIGMLTKKRTFSLLTFKDIKQGLSGGISLLGLTASIVGASIIALLGALTYSINAALFILIVGIFGALFDSFLGELIQAKYQSESGEITENNSQEDSELELVSGYASINNNSVNILSSLITVCSTVIIYFIII